MYAARTTARSAGGEIHGLHQEIFPPLGLGPPPQPSLKHAARDQYLPVGALPASRDDNGDPALWTSSRSGAGRSRENLAVGEKPSPHTRCGLIPVGLLEQSHPTAHASVLDDGSFGSRSRGCGIDKPPQVPGSQLGDLWRSLIPDLHQAAGQRGNGVLGAADLSPGEGSACPSHVAARDGPPQRGRRAGGPDAAHCQQMFPQTTSPSAPVRVTLAGQGRSPGWPVKGVP